MFCENATIVGINVTECDITLDPLLSIQNPSRNREYGSGLERFHFQGKKKKTPAVGFGSSDRARERVQPAPEWDSQSLKWVVAFSGAVEDLAAVSADYILERNH